MRKVSVFNSVTLDGVMQAPGGPEEDPTGGFVHGGVWTALADTVAAHLSLKIPEKQELLEIVGVGPRLERVFAHMESEIGVLQVEKRIRNRVKRQMEKTQREY